MNPHPIPAPALSVNVNKVALLRNARPLAIPSVCKAAQCCLQAGAHGITVHPRPDERHIRASDVRDLAALMHDWPGREFNIEGNPFHNLMPHVRQVRPQQVTFVPDSAQQSTSDHGWDLALWGAQLRPLIAECVDLGVRVSLFLDPDPAQIQATKALGAQRIELYTEPYAAAHGTAAQAQVLATYAEAARLAHSLGLAVNAGHDLNRNNLADLVAALPALQEVSIGHALIADALELGYAETVQQYQRCIQAGVARRKEHLA
jgi:pyridoxine 5-phosphate synthase